MNFNSLQKSFWPRYSRTVKNKPTLIFKFKSIEYSQAISFLGHIMLNTLLQMNKNSAAAALCVSEARLDPLVVYFPASMAAAWIKQNESECD